MNMSLRRPQKGSNLILHNLLPKMSLTVFLCFFIWIHLHRSVITLFKLVQIEIMASTMLDMSDVPKFSMMSNWKNNLLFSV